MILTLAILALCAPAGYLAGDVFVHKNKSSQDWLPIACAVFAPLGGIIALLVIVQAEGED